MGDEIRKALAPISSLRLTVALLAMLIVLVFAGTLAQVDMGIWTTLTLYFRAFLVWIPLQVFLPREWEVGGAFPFPAGYTIGTLLLMNLLAAHAVRFKLAFKRSGIMLIHLGLIMLLVGEVVTGQFADEAHMTIDEGRVVNFTEDTRQLELAIIDRSDSSTDQVVVIPESILRKERLIEHPLLPFEVQVDNYFWNAVLRDSDEMPDGTLPQANRGTAARLGLHAVEAPVASGVERNGFDLPAAVVTLYQNGTDLGSWLTSLYFTLPGDFQRPINDIQEVQVDGRTYHLVLRYKRTYKPYSLELVDFRHDRYLGTDTPKNFSSQVRLVDPSRNVDREVLIYMNNPLRYRGETFYQASFKRTETTTILQVVRNPGWLLPYIACTLGAIGMLFHFGMHLTKFLRRKRS